MNRIWKTSGQAGTFTELSHHEDPHAAGQATRADKLPAPNFEGKLYGVQNDAIVGWAWDSSRPYDAVEVELYCADLLVGRGMADQFDLDLAKARRGNGVHRLELRLDRLPAESPPFNIRAVIAGTEVELFPPIVLHTLQEAEQLLSGVDYAGRIAGISDGMICGWALNRRNPHETPVLTFRDGDHEIATQPALEQTTATVDSGAVATVFRFQFPLPAIALDGRLHSFSVTAGPTGRQLSGSPVLFGPSDTVSMGRTLIALLERIERVERRLESVRTDTDISQLETRLLSKLIEPVDMLLGVHRDSIEREMAVMRRQLVQLVRHAPEMDTDLIAPLTGEGVVEDVAVPQPAAFNVIDRAAPMMKYDLAVRTPLARPKGGLEWIDGGAGVLLRDSGSIELDGLVTEKASVVLQGRGAAGVAEFCGMVIGFNGRPMCGRFDIGANGGWTFIGDTIESTVEILRPAGLSIDYLLDVLKPTGQLMLDEVFVFAPGRAPLQIGTQSPTSSVLDLGKEGMSAGWHSVEAGRRGGVCWMGEKSEVSLNLRSAGSYEVYIPEIRPLMAEIVPKLQLRLNDEPVETKIARIAGDSSTYSLRGHCSIQNDASEELTLRLSFPKECVKSPMELGLNQDMRPLTIAVRCIAVGALESKG